MNRRHGKIVRQPVKILWCASCSLPKRKWENWNLLDIFSVPFSRRILESSETQSELAFYHVSSESSLFTMKARFIQSRIHQPTHFHVQATMKWNEMKWNEMKWNEMKEFLLWVSELRIGHTVYEDLGSIPDLLVATSRGVGWRRGLDLAWLWLWCRLVTTAPIPPLAWEHPYATGVAVKRKKIK